MNVWQQGRKWLDTIQFNNSFGQTKLNNLFLINFKVKDHPISFAEILHATEIKHETIPSSM